MPLSKSQRERNRKMKVLKRAHGRLRTEAGLRKKRLEWPFDLLPREGRGSWQTSGDDLGPRNYRVLRNNLPVYFSNGQWADCKPYVYGAPREKWAVASLNLEAIAAADRAMEAAKHTTDSKRSMRPEQRVQLMECLGLGLAVRDIRELTGLSAGTIKRYLHMQAGGSR